MSKITFTKNGAEKFLDKDSKLIPIILADGWEKVNTKKETKKKEDK